VRSSPLISISAKRRRTDQIESHRCHEAPGDRYGLYGLVERAGTDGLDLYGALLADDAGKRTGDRVRTRLCGYLENLHGASRAADRVYGRLYGHWYV